MSQNMGTPDRAVRTALGLGIFVALLIGAASGIVGAILAILAAVLVLTSAIGFCPIYAIFNISTRRKHALQQTKKSE